MTRTLQGIVEHGDARGRQLGFPPTANLQTDRAAELDGVWAASPTSKGLAVTWLLSRLVTGQRTIRTPRQP